MVIWTSRKSRTTRLETVQARSSQPGSAASANGSIMLSLRLVYGNERGIVLAVALMLLAILTLMGSAAIVTTRTDVKIAGNWNAHTRTYHAAEAGSSLFR